MIVIMKFGSIVGTGNETNTKVTNCYYLEGTYAGGINGKDENGQAEPKEKDEMITQEFVNKLNENDTEETVWKKDEKGGYPIFN